MWGVYKVDDGQEILLGRFAAIEDAGAAMDLYRSTFDDNSQLLIKPEG